MWPAPLEFCAACGKLLGPRSASLFWCTPGCMERWQRAQRNVIEPAWDSHRRVADPNERMATRTATVVQALPWMDVRATE